MKNLLLMRHAKSSWNDPSLPDHQRPLNKRGKRDAPRMGRHLRAQGLALDALLCSTAVRARETAQGFLQEYPFDGEVSYIEDLYQAGPGTILALLQRLPQEVETVLLIGHNPGLDEFLETACDEYDHLTTACVAHIQFPVQRWVDLRQGTRGALLHFWKPREV